MTNLDWCSPHRLLNLDSYSSFAFCFIRPWSLPLPVCLLAQLPVVLLKRNKHHCIISHSIQPVPPDLFIAPGICNRHARIYLFDYRFHSGHHGCDVLIRRGSPTWSALLSGFRGYGRLSIYKPCFDCFTSLSLFSSCSLFLCS